MIDDLVVPTAFIVVVVGLVATMFYLNLSPKVAEGIACPERRSIVFRVVKDGRMGEIKHGEFCVISERKL